MELQRIATVMMCVIAAVYSAPTPSTAPKTCTVPSTEKLQKQLTSGPQDIIHESFAMLPYFGEMVSQNLYSGNDWKFPIGDEETECPAKPSVTADSVNKRNLCPTYTIMNYSPNRYPTTLIEKECACKDHCSGDPDRVCEKFSYYVQVLVRQRGECDAEGDYIYVSKYQQITLGCGCGEPRRT